MFETFLFFWGGGGGQQVRSHPRASLRYKRLYSFATLWAEYMYARFRRLIFKLGKFTDFKAFSPAVSVDIRVMVFYQNLKKKKNAGWSIYGHFIFRLVVG